MSLSRQGCIYHNTVQHELLHALGFNHEQTRSDRDNHIRVLWENISEGGLLLIFIFKTNMIQSDSASYIATKWFFFKKKKCFSCFLLRHEVQFQQNQHSEPGNFLRLQLCHAISQVRTISFDGFILAIVVQGLFEQLVATECYSVS